MKPIGRCVSIFVLHLMVSSVQSSVTKVLNISPLKGSRNGGTRITVKGVNFSKNYFSFGQGNENLGSKVWLTSLTSYPCDIHPDGSHQSQITCYTVPMPIGKYTIKVSVDGVDVMDTEYCPLTTDCQFTVTDVNTPTIDTIRPASGLPGAFLEVSGTLVTTRYAANEPNETQTLILRVYFGGQKCELRDFEKDSVYGISVDVHGKGYFKCKTEGTYIGNHNISFLINNNYGRSLPSPALKQVHRNGIGMYQTFTEINGLSVSKGSRAGGTQLKITGKYFDETDSPVEVYVGDKPCKVLSPINDTEITCVTPEESNVLSHFSGNRGMFVFLQKGITDPFHLDKNEATVEHIDESTWSTTDTGPHAIQMVGYFVPAYTGHYSFCLKAAARAYLYLSLSSNPNDKTLFLNGSVTMCTIETSNTVSLEADRKYYMEVYYGASTFASYVTVATILSESPYSQEVTGLAEHEKQEITITSATVQEVQEPILRLPDCQKEYILATHVSDVPIGGSLAQESQGRLHPEMYALHISSSGNPGTISPDVQMITIEGSTLDCSFVLGLNGAYTVPIRIIGMTSSSVQSEIKKLPSISFPVSVVVNFGSSSVVLTLTSSSPEGDISLFDALEIGKDKHLSFSVKKLSRGRPTLGSYTLELAGVKTSPIDVTADKLKLQQSLLQLFSVRCHPIFYGGLFVMSFETVPSSGAVSDVEPFCGRYSSKNVANVIKRTWINGIRISLINSKYMCFAYKGSGMIELVKIQYGFNDVNSQIKTIYATFHVSNDTPDEWSYWCEDVVGLFKSVVAKGFAPRILNVWISTKNAADLYVDEILFTRNSVLETIAGNFKLLRMSQARLNGTFIDAVTVQGNFPSFNIILKPHHCGQNIPLLGVAYASFQDNEYVVTNEGSLTIKITSSVKASPPIEGTFSIRFKGEDSGPIAIDSIVRPDNLYSALSSMSIGVSKVEALGICSYRNFVVTMISLLGNQPVMEIDSSHLTGLNVLCNVKTIKDGGLRFEPITGDFLRSYHTTPQVFALINNVPTKCAATSSCTFEWEPASTPSITEIQPTSGSPGTSLEITGTGFDVIASNNEVLVGNSTCSMQTSTESKITCVVGSGSAGSVQVKVSVKGKGHAIRPALFTYTETILSMLPLSGSAGGGTLLTITGNGFINSDEIKIDGNECTIQSLSATQVTCRTPTPNSFLETSKSVNVELVSASNTRVIGSFTYNPDVSFTPTVSSISTFETTTWGKKRFTISGKGFGNIEMPVMIGNIRSTILSYSDTAIVAILPSLPENTYKLIIDVAEKGYADLRKYSIPDIKYTFNVLSLSPNFGSLYGGTDLVITGNGFSVNSSQMSVAVGTHQCNIMDLTDTSIKCRIEDTGKYHTVSATGIHKLLGYGYAWDKDPVTIQVGDYITWTWQTPQYVSDIAYSIQQTATAFDAESLPDGFSSGNKSRRGTFTHQFTAAGTYYYWTGYMDNNQTIYFRGKVTVYELQSYSAELSVQVLGVEAEYTNNKVDQSGSASEQNENTVCKDSRSLTDSCLHGITLMLFPNKFYFHFFKCFSPFFVSTSKNNGSFSDVIAITGSGFGESLCQNEVSYASQPCSIQSVDLTKIEFTISSSSTPPIGMGHPFQVRIKNYGYALFTHSLPRKNRFVLWPKVSHISPTEGSKVGGTIITVVGAGFIGNPQLISVQFDSLSCFVKSVNYNKIICETRCGLSCNAGVQKVKVYIPGHDGMITAECTGNQCSLFTTESFTALVTSVVPEIVDSDSTTLKVSGNHFLSSSTSLAVYIGEQHCSVIGEITNTDFACTIGRLPVGPNEIKVYAGTYGLAFTTKKVTSKAVATITIPVSASIYGGAMMVIDGNGFTQQTSVKVDSTVCSIVKISLSQVKCILPAHAEGSIPVSIISNNVQYSPLSLSYSQTSTPKVTNISPDCGQTNTEITITGTGFDSPAVGATPEVKIGGVACTNVSDTSATSITCTTGPHNTGVFVVQVFVEQKGFSNMDQTFTYQLASFTLTPLKGSTNGGQLVTLTGSGFLQGKTSVTICGLLCQEVSLTTLQYICKTAAVNDTPSSCDVVAAVDKVSQILASVYAYDSSLASSVTLVSPSRGGTAGGTLVTITGSGFGTSNESLSVKIASVICDVQSVINSEIKCITGPSASIVSEVEVNVNNQGIAKQVNAQFEYIDVWSNPFTWGGQPQPEDGDFIVIPANQTILLDTDTAVLKMLLIQGGQLIFDEENIELKAENILITDGGILQIGSPNKPFPAKYKAIITLYGHLRSKEIPIYGAKTLAVRNGTLKLYGSPVEVVWTKLSKTATAGTKTIELEHSVDWKAGDQIVIATTGERHSQGETEVGIIQSVEGNKVTLENELKYEHLGTVGQFGSQTVDFKGEVGLLTRNILIRGNRDVSFDSTIPACPAGFNTGEFAIQTCFQGRFGEEIGSSQFGSQIMVHQLGKDHQAAQAHIQYVEITFAGQAFRLGRYPVHFHLNGDMSNSFVRGCAIHTSFNRAVNVHGSHNALIEYNILYNVMGGAFFLEDGNEVGNIFQYNLAIFVKSSTSLRNDDITPAAFWATNPNNTIRHNAVAGSTHFGYWYRMHLHPDGPGFDVNICPQAAPLLEFRNNSAHSLGWFGLWIFETFVPRKDGSCFSKAPHQVATFYSLTAWNCQKGAESVNFGALQFHQFILVSNELSGFEGKVIRQSPPQYDKEAGPGLFDSVIVDHYNNLLAVGSGAGVTLPHQTGFLVEGVKFINFDKPNRAAFRWALMVGVCLSQCVGPAVRTRGLEFTDSPNKVYFDWESQGILVDEDGSLTGGVNNSVVACSPSYDSNKCQENLSFSGGNNAGCICNEVKFFRFGFNNINPEILQGANALFSSSFGVTSSPYLLKRMTHKNGWSVLLMANTFYNFTIERAPALVNLSYDSTFYNLDSGDYVVFSHVIEQQPDRFHIDGYTQIPMSSEMLTDNNLESGQWFFKETSKTLYYAVKSTVNSVNFPVKLRIIRCFFPDCKMPAITNILSISEERSLWSHKETWQNITVDGLEPQYLSDLTIPEGKRIVVDKPIPRLGQLIIIGVLEFLENEMMNVKLEAECIYVLGRLVAGWNKTSPFEGNLVLRMRSGKIICSHPVDGGPFLGSKFIAVFGGLQLHGKDRGIIKTHLASTVDSGNTITITDAVSWTSGDIILITTTDYNPWHTETFTIDSISGTTITLNDTIKYRHIAHKETVQSNVIDLHSIVALLSRNIKIESEEKDNLFNDSLGTYIIVGQSSYKDQQLSGFAQISNVEFYHTGQDGFKDNTDPRFSIAFVDVISSEESIRYSYVKTSSFYCCFNTAIGVFAVNDLEIDSNIVYHTVGAGIRTESIMTRISNNLITLTVWPGTYKGYVQETIPFFEGSIEAILAEDLVLVNNFVAGSERIGYHLRGQSCNTNMSWERNVAIGTLLGVASVPSDNVADSECVMFSGFLLWKNFDFGIYYNNVPNVVLRNNVLVENGVSILTMVLGPDSLKHEYSNKFANIDCNIVIGKTSTFSERLDFLNGTLVQASGTLRGHGKSACGKIGLEITTFSKCSNSAPLKELVDSKDYPSIRGILNLSNNVFVNFKSCSSGQDYIIATNPNDEDACHPVLIRNSTLVNVQHTSKIFLNKPDVSLVNPSDCVDMDCDGPKKCLIQDLDGTFLGHIGTVLPNSAYEWNGDPRHGLGDYRIPTLLLTRSDGSKIDANTLAPKKGIYKTDQCTWNAEWNAFECDVIFKWRQLSIESMDADTETRRLSPVAIYNEEGYIDLINGPQSHGWCSGYTCTQRLSLFQAIVSLDKTFSVYLSSVFPKKLRLMLQVSEVMDCTAIALPYSHQNRMEVRVNNKFVMPTNGYIDSKGNYRLHLVWDNLTFIPDVQKKVNGENFLSQEKSMFYFIVCGDSEITVTQAPVLVLILTLVAVSEEEFFSEKIVENLAAFLNVNTSKVRIVNVVRNKPVVRSKRDTSNVSYVVEIADAPIEEPTVDYDYLSSRIAIQAQLGKLKDELRLPVLSTYFIAPGDSTGKVVEMKVIQTLVLVTQPVGDVVQGEEFKVQPQLNVLDINGNAVDNLGFLSLKWVVEASIVGNEKENTTLVNNSAVFEGPWANFSQMAILTSGVYTLRFQITNPPEASQFSVLSNPVTIYEFEAPTFQTVPTTQPDIQVHLVTTKPLTNEPIIIHVVLLDKWENSISSWMMMSWTVELRILSTYVYNGYLGGSFTASIDNTTGQATLNIILGKPGRCPLILNVKSDSYLIPKLFFMDIMTLEQANLVIEETHRIEIMYSLQYKAARAPYWSAYVRNYYSHLSYMRIIHDEFKEGSLIVILTVETNSSSLLLFMNILCKDYRNEVDFNFIGILAKMSDKFKINGSISNHCDQFGTRKQVGRSFVHGLSLVAVTAIVVACVVLLIVLLALSILHMKNILLPHSSNDEQEPATVKKDVIEKPFLIFEEPVNVKPIIGNDEQEPASVKNDVIERSFLTFEEQVNVMPIIGNDEQKPATVKNDEIEKSFLTFEEPVSNKPMIDKESEDFFSMNATTSVNEVKSQTSTLIL